VEYIDKN
jgi:hypothetical protein